MESGPTVWLIVLTVGAVAPGLAIAYGIMRNQTRTPAEKNAAEIASSQERQAEDRDET